MTTYETETGSYVLRDADGKVCVKADVPTGAHPVPDYVDPDKSEDVENAEELAGYDIHEDYRTEL